MVSRFAPGCAAHKRRLVRGSAAACLLASLTGCADFLGIDDLSPRADAGVDAGGPPPPSPTLRMPMNGTRVGSLSLSLSRRPMFAWQPMEGNVTFVLEYGTDPTFATGVTRLETGQPSYQPAEDLPVSLTPPVGARYYWRVSACAGARCSPPSGPWYVEVARLRPDVNGDGFDDVLVGAPADSQNAPLAGSILAYRGESATKFETGVDGVIPSFVEGEQLGRSLALGDFDGDGFAEIVGGIPLHLDESGGFHVYPGSADAPEVINAPVSVPGLVPRTRFGNTLATGDFNADGFADLVVSDVGPGAGMDQVGHVSVYLGAPGGFDTSVDRILAGREVGDGFGRLVASGGDVNGDGYDDLLVGIPGTRQVDIYFGGPDGPFEDQPSVTLSEPNLENFPTSLAGAGDMNGDGYHEVLVGFPDSVYVYRGGPGTLDTRSDAVLDGFGQPGFGTVVGSGGDMNSDGRAEILIAYSTETRVAIAGYDSDLISLLTIDLDPAASLADVALSRPSDFNGDGRSDVVAAGGPDRAVRVYYGGSFMAPQVSTLQSSAGGDGFGAAIAP